jgi:hypothetical protein
MHGTTGSDDDNDEDNDDIDSNNDTNTNTTAAVAPAAGLNPSSRDSKTETKKAATTTPPTNAMPMTRKQIAIPKSSSREGKSSNVKAPVADTRTEEQRQADAVRRLLEATAREKAARTGNSNTTSGSNNDSQFRRQLQRTTGLLPTELAKQAAEPASGNAPSAALTVVAAAAATTSTVSSSSSSSSPST